LRQLGQREWEKKMLAKKLKSALVGSGMLGAALFAASAAFAGPIALPGGAGLSLQLNGVTQINPANNDVCAACGGAVPASNGSQSAGVGGEGNWGVFVINTINPAVPLIPNSELSQSGAAIWSNGGGVGSPGQQVLAIAYGIQNTTFGSPSTARDGVIDLYWWDANTQSDANTSLNGGIGLRNNISQTGAIGSGYTGYTCAPGTPGCTFLAELDLVPENPHGAGGDTTFYDANDPTLFAGASYFEAEVDLTKGGAWAASLAADYFSLNNPALGSLPIVDASDANGAEDTRPCFAGECGAGWSGQPGVTIRDSDPVQFFTKVPEPGTLSLFGMGLLGLGFMARRRNAKDSKA